MWNILLRFAKITTLASLLNSAAAPASAEETVRDRLVIGLVPALSPENFTRRFAPMATYLEDRLGIDVVLAGAPNYAVFANRVREGSHYDMLITGADLYRFAEKKAGYRVIVRLSIDKIGALILVRKNSRFETVGDLKGKTISTADPLSLSCRLGMITLREAGLINADDVNILATPSQNSSLSALLAEQSDASIVISPVFWRAPKDIKEKVRILAETPTAVSHPISVSPSVPEDLVKRLTDALVTMEEHAAGVAFLEAMQWPPLIAASSDDYESMDWAVPEIESQLKAIGEIAN